MGNEPYFYDSLDFPFLAELEKNIPQIQEEVLNYLEPNQNLFSPYFNTDMMSDKDSWSALIFLFWGQKGHDIEPLPILKKELEKIPHLTSIALSRIKANSVINRHAGDSNFFVRCHIPISIPSGLPDCGFQVEDELRPWDPTKLLLFCDAYNHYAFNNTGVDRVVLIIDFLLKDFYTDKSDLMSTVISGLWSQQLELKSRVFKILPSTIKNMCRLGYKRYVLLFQSSRFI